MLDQTNIMIKYHLYATEQILKNPNCYDEIAVMERQGKGISICKKYVQQGTAIRYQLDHVYKNQIEK